MVVLTRLSILVASRFLLIAAYYPSIQQKGLPWYFAGDLRLDVSYPLSNYWELGHAYPFHRRYLLLDGGIEKSAQLSQALTGISLGDHR